MVFAGAIGIAKSFIYCYFGKCATDYYTSYAECLFESNWMVLPNDLQKYFILMISHAQKPLYYHGYGFVHLDLQLFSKVSINNVH